MPSPDSNTEAEVVAGVDNEDDEILAALNEADAENNGSIEPASADDTITEPDVDDAAVLADLEGSGDKNVEASQETPAEQAPKAQEKVEPKPLREFADVSGMDKKAVNAALDGVAKKVGEKAQNLIAAIEQGKKLSRFTRSAVRELVDNGAISGKSMTDRFLVEGLTEGTARAQAQQMTNLFKRLGVVKPKADDARTLIPANTRLLEELDKLAA